MKNANLKKAEPLYFCIALLEGIEVIVSNDLSTPELFTLTELDKQMVEINMGQKYLAIEIENPYFFNSTIH